MGRHPGPHDQVLHMLRNVRVHGTHCSTSPRCTQQRSICIPTIRGALQHVTRASHVLRHARHVCHTASATCYPLHIPHVASVKVWRNFGRERYRKAAELSRVRGKLSCLLINDLDAGLGHFKNTQVTVNNQARSATPV